MSDSVDLYRPVGPEELEELNRNIVGRIEVIAEYEGGPDREPQRVC